MSFTYRTATPADAAACAAIIHAWGAETPWMVSLDELDPMAAFWADLFDTEAGWVAESDGKVVGFCARSDDNIDGLYVAQTARGFGVGKALLDLAKGNRDWITVWAYEENRATRKFYRREGLVETQRELAVYDDGSSLMDVEHRWIRPD